MKRFDLNEKETTKFVLITMQRSGSTLLSEYLSSHDDIYMAKELFKVDAAGRNGLLEGSYHQSKTTVGTYLDTFYTKHSNKAQAVGFKVMLGQLEANPEIMEYIKAHDIQCVFLERENLLKQYISHISAKKRKFWHVEKKTVLKPISVDITQLKHDMKILQEQRTRFQTMVNELNSFTVSYEELVENRVNVLKNIQTFFTVPTSENLAAPLEKINSDDLSEIIINYNDLYHELSGTEYKKYLTPLSKRRLKKNLKTLLVHVPKTGGTSIEKAFYGTVQTLGHRKAIDYYKQDKEGFQESFSFAFVRNPFDRLVSAYTYLKSGGSNQNDSTWASKHLQKYDTFKDFVLSLRDPSIQKNILTWMHFIPQYKFVCNDREEVIVDFIGRYEHLASDFDHLYRYFDTVSELPHENKSNRSDYEEYYDDEMKGIVRDIYEKDFELFGYDPQYSYEDQADLIMKQKRIIREKEIKLKRLHRSIGEMSSVGFLSHPLEKYKRYKKLLNIYFNDKT